MRILLPIVAFLAACGDSTDGETPAECEAAPTWDEFASGYVATWCVPCHTESLVGEARQGAPEPTNFDTWSDVYAWRASILQRAVYDAVSPMPPLAGVPKADVDLFRQWLECGALGADDPPDPCLTVVSGPATTIANQADADAFCGAYNAAESLTISGSAEVECLCSVAGELAVHGGELDATSLTEVGGDLVVDDGAAAVRAPALRHVGGSVRVVGAASLAELALAELDTVDGDIQIAGAEQLEHVSLDALFTVGGALTVSDDASLVTFDLPRLRSTGGDLVLENLPELSEILGTRAIDHVGGSFVLRYLPRLTNLDDQSFWFMYTIGQDMIITDNENLFAIDGFTLLQDVPGDLVVEDNASLLQVNGFDNVVHVGGDVRFRNNPDQQHVMGLYNVSDIDGELVLENLFAANAFLGFNELESVGGLRASQVGEVVLEDFDALVAVEGDLAISGCSKMTGITGLASLATVSGSFSLSDNEDLADISGLAGVVTIGGSATVTDNPLLATSSIDEWLAGVGVGGTVTVSGNGP